jgi:kynurenine formamidase
MSTKEGARPAPPYREATQVSFLGVRFNVLDLSHEISPEIPVYPGHMKVAFWDHMTHAESRLRLGDSPFRGYAVKGISLCDHDSTHMDAIYHFNPDRPDLTIDTFPIEYCFTEAVWIDVSDVPPRTHISLDRVRRALETGGVTELPRGGSLLYYTGAAQKWTEPLAFVSQYAGLDAEASRWVLDQGIVNVLTDAVSTDNPADLTYPNHTAHAEYLVNHTEVVANINKIPMHQGFGLMVVPLRLMGCTGSPVRIFALWRQ